MEFHGMICSATAYAGCAARLYWPLAVVPQVGSLKMAMAKLEYSFCNYRASRRNPLEKPAIFFSCVQVV